MIAPRLGILAIRTVTNRPLHTSAVLSRVGQRRAPPRANKSAPHTRVRPSPKRALPLAKPSKPLSLGQVRASLIRDIDAWCHRLAPSQVTALGIPKYLANQWLELFPLTVKDELEALDSENPKSNDTWDLQSIANDMLEDAQFGISRAYMIRFLDFALARLESSDSPTPALQTSLEALKQATNLEHMVEWYPLARSMRRKIIMHVGPTNSGKTYNALQALAGAESGVYAGPLRLLAHEVWTRINKGSIAPKSDTIDLDDAAPSVVVTEGPDSTPQPQVVVPAPPKVYAGRPCNLITGEDQRVVSPHATILSCTVEMIPKHLVWSVGVIDEIQMLADPQRGGAWTSAVLGLAAEELHLCGEDTVVDLVRELCRMTGDELIVNRYERLTPLEIAPYSLKRSLANVERGDCVVTFSRNEIFLTKSKIEKETGLRCAVVYGRLPPEVRNEQAQLFNDEESGYDVIVASDAVGMGLNLKIKRVVFMRTEKWNGKQDTPLSIPLIKQIAGRAGRFGLIKSKDKDAEAAKETHPTSMNAAQVASIAASQPPGLVTALREDSLERIREALSTPNPKVDHARVDITNPNTEALAQALPPGIGITELLDTMRLLARLPPHTKLGLPNLEQRASMASPAHVFNFDSQRPDDISVDIDLLTRSLPLNDRLVLAQAPVRWRDPIARQAGLKFIQAYEEEVQVNIRKALKGLGLIEGLDEIQYLKSKWKKQQKYTNKKRLPEDYKDGILDAEDLSRLGAETLANLESLHSTLVLYMWLSFRLPLGFYQAPEAQAMKTEVEKGIEWCLEMIRASKKKHIERVLEDEDEEAEAEPKKKIEYLSKDAVQQWRREGMTPAVWSNLLENARRAAT
ncbi:ATP-dependent RNA helicase SUV3L, mitochondrial [Rhizoctonia solani]|uniref:RNA helicase n=1 Tax=Rhizoctonia solani TaxID=456999 RepID=A0A0K6G1J5_9AGAM|nr:ATP-dependent RNA helicase SUV3L, mitochondrial [Rhizoctonia solani]